MRVTIYRWNSRDDDNVLKQRDAFLGAVSRRAVFPEYRPWDEVFAGTDMDDIPEEYAVSVALLRAAQERTDEMTDDSPYHNYASEIGGVGTSYRHGHDVEVFYVFARKKE